MSMAALLQAVRDFLRDELQLTPGECEVMYDGQPPPAAGERFIAIHEGEWRPANTDDALDEYFGIDVTVTLRSARVPRDRAGAAILIGPTGRSLDNLCRSIIKPLHKDRPGTRGYTSNYPVIGIANGIIGAASSGFIEPLVFKGAARARPVGPDWFSADVEGASPAVGIVRELHFGDARRIQALTTEES